MQTYILLTKLTPELDSRTPPACVHRKHCFGFWGFFNSFLGFFPGTLLDRKDSGPSQDSNTEERRFAFASLAISLSDWILESWKHLKQYQFWSTENHLFLFQGLLLVYDVTNKDTFSMLNYWLDSIDRVRFHSCSPFTNQAFKFC